MFTGVLPQFVAILLFVGFALAVLSSETIRRLIGEETGFIGMLLASLVGAVSLVQYGRTVSTRYDCFPHCFGTSEKRRGHNPNGGICFYSHYGWADHNPDRDKISE